MLLEAGCGVGNCIFPLLEDDLSIFVYACDFSPRAVEFVKVRYPYIKCIVCLISRPVNHLFLSLSSGDTLLYSHSKLKFFKPELTSTNSVFDGWMIDIQDKWFEAGQNKWNLFLFTAKPSVLPWALLCLPVWFNKRRSEGQRARGQRGRHHSHLCPVGRPPWQDEAGSAEHRQGESRDSQVERLTAGFLNCWGVFFFFSKLQNKLHMCLIYTWIYIRIHWLPPPHPVIGSANKNWFRWCNVWDMWLLRCWSLEASSCSGTTACMTTPCSDLKLAASWGRTSTSAKMAPGPTSSLKVRIQDSYFHVCVIETEDR